MGRLQRLVRRLEPVAHGVRWSFVASAVGVVVFVAVLLAVIVYLPPLAIDPRGLSRTDWLTHVDNLRGHVLQGLGGLALLGTLYFSARTLRLNRRGQVTERFTKAIEQLASEKLAIRLGGIYALEQIALDSEELHWPVMEVLTAFLRENSATGSARSVIEALHDHLERATPLAWDPGEAGTMQPGLATDLQAIATVLGRRPEQRRRSEERTGRQLDLSGVWLPKARLAGAHLEGANLKGARLHWASFVGANLRGANLAGAHLYESHLEGAHLEEAYFGGANLVRASLGKSFLLPPDSEANGAHLAGASFSGARLMGTTFRGTDVTGDQLGQGTIDDETLLPSRLNLEELLDDQKRRQKEEEELLTELPTDDPYHQ
jgi:hypothetical protein